MLAQMLAPAAVLVAWSIVVLFWMAFTRLPALGKAGGLGEAATVIIALMGAGAADVVFAWIYVALRIVHSIWQATVNVVKIRFLLFIASTVALIYLAYRALALTLFHDPALVAV